MLRLCAQFHLRRTRLREVERGVVCSFRPQICVTPLSALVDSEMQALDPVSFPPRTTLDQSVGADSCCLRFEVTERVTCKAQIWKETPKEKNVQK